MSRKQHIAQIFVLLPFLAGTCDAFSLHRSKEGLTRGRIWQSTGPLFQASPPSENRAEASESSSKRNLLSVPNVALTALIGATVAAKSGIILGAPLDDGFSLYTDSMIARDIGCTALTAVLGYAFVKLTTWLASSGYAEPRDTRKLVHTLSAPLFMIFWPLFSPAHGARFFAAIVPLSNMVRLFLAGTGEDKSLAYAVSRSGDADEALGGPFIYVTILLVATLIFWRDNPIGIVALSAMAAGDGLADLAGRRLGKNNKWSFSPDKSVAGSLAFWFASTICAAGLLSWLSVDLSSSFTIEPLLAVAGIMAVTAFLELLPSVDDNLVVPLSAAILTAIFLK